MHLLHILEDYSKGYISGVNTNHWKKHVLADSNCIFYYVDLILSLLSNYFIESTVVWLHDWKYFLNVYLGDQKNRRDENEQRYFYP